MNPYAKIVSSISGGERAAALRDIEAMLSASPGDSELLALKGLALALDGRLDEGSAAVREAVVRARTPAQRLKHAGNLARLLSNGGRRDEIARLPELDLPSLALLADDEFDAPAIANLCAPLLLAGQNDFVARYLAPVLERPGATWDIEHIWLKAATAAGQHAEILARFKAPSCRWGDRPAAIAFACIAAVEEGRLEEADKLKDAYASAAPPYIAPRSATQVMSVVVLSQDPAPSQMTAPLARQHLVGNYPSQIAAKLADRYRIISTFVGSRPGAVASEISPGEPAIVLNNCVNGEALKRGQLARVQAHEQALGLGVVNAAAQAVHCTRVETAELLRGIPNLIVPQALRFRLQAELLPALRMRIQETFPFPIILRSVGEQEGANIHLATNHAELGSTLSALLALGDRDFYAIAYAGVEHRNGFFRRIRAAFVEGTPTLIRADYDDQWKVWGRKFNRILNHYRRDPALFQEAQDIVLQPQRLGDKAWAALAEIGRRIPLDVFGMDFDVDHEGRVVFFESNATMLLLSNAPPELDYPQDAQRSFLKRLDALFMKRAGLSVH